MGTTATRTSPDFVVIDASAAIALCANEPDKHQQADAVLQQYILDECPFFAPQLIVMECQYALCRKLNDGILTEVEHATALLDLIDFLDTISLPPGGDASLLLRAEQIRTG